MRVLTRGGVLKFAKEGRVRGAVEHFYKLTDGGRSVPTNDTASRLLGLCGCLALPSPSGGYPVPVELDDQAREELMALLDELKPRVEKVAKGAAKRRPGC